MESCSSQHVNLSKPNEVQAVEIKDCLTAAQELDKPLPGYLAPGAAVIALILLEMQSVWGLCGISQGHEICAGDSAREM